MKIGNYEFEGPFPIEQTWQVQNRSGVYVILTGTLNNRYKVLDVGESESLRDRIENHDREDCWRRNRQAGLYVAVLYCDEQSRMRIEEDLRATFSPVCGVR